MSGDPVAPGDPRRLRVVATAADLLLSNGNTTSSTVTVVEDLARRLDVPVRVVPAWDGSALLDADGRTIYRVEHSPTTVNMSVVIAVMATLHRDDAKDVRRLSDDLATAGLKTPYNTAVFAGACVTGATALAVIFGARLPVSYLLIAIAAGLGAIVRRQLGARAVGPIGQAFAAALVAGLAGALSVHLGTASDARLVAVCPAMVLVPGPHLLNGALDLAAHRFSLAWARLTFGSLIVIGISIGLILGLAAGGSGLPVAAAGRSVTWWIDIPAAAVAAASYPVFFTLNARYIPYAAIAGAGAHAVRWLILSQLGFNIVVADFVACLVAGLLVAPVVRTRHIPFAGIGFAAVVALVPGVYIFRAVAGMVDLLTTPNQPLLLETATDATTAILSLSAIALGLLTAHGVSTRIASRR